MSLVEYSMEGSVAVVCLNRPPVNALSLELSTDLNEAFGRAEDPAVRAVVVTGQPHFAAGADIKGFQAAYDSGKMTENLAYELVDAIWRLESLAKPTIAAIFGYALGGGLELSMGCDFRYFAEDAQVGQPEIKLGIIPGAGGTQRLARIVGFQKAKEIVYSGRFVPAAEAQELGLADKVFPPDELLDRAMEDARRYAEGPTVALGAAKRALIGGLGLHLRDAMEVERQAFLDSFWTDDAREGVAAFLEKRRATFGGT
ncbi:MAG: enoyl-CoA hydratase-related protein [bacterium]|nr:enoyl-CoA hydratase/isomerase family protein [Acidimicrobiia bacterium]MCY4650640.1 enoyl-CoA hydratase-related protein [bacterium]